MRSFILVLFAGAPLLLPPAAAAGAPGLGTKVYGTEVEQGVLELELRHGRLNAGPHDGQSATAAEVGYGLTDRVNVAVVAEMSREQGHEAELDELSAEVVFRVGALPGEIDFAVYAEYAATLHGRDDELEFRALFDKELGPLQGRLNLIAERSLAGGEEAEFGYAASVDGEAAKGVRLGLQAFGGEDGDGRVFDRGTHYAGPAATFEFSGVELEAGYLLSLGEARDEADGQFRLRLGFEKPL